MSYLDNFYKFNLVCSVFSGKDITAFIQSSLTRKRYLLEIAEQAYKKFNQKNKIKKIKKLEYEVLNDIEKQYDT